MVKRMNELTKEVRSNARGGIGDLPFTHYLMSEETGGRAKMIAQITIPAGCSIGEHSHGEEGEMYLVTKGNPTITDNGEEIVLSVGDVMWTADGNTHSIMNKTNSECEIIAIVI